MTIKWGVLALLLAAAARPAGAAAPTVDPDLPALSTVTTLGGSLTGRSTGPAIVTATDVSVKDLTSGLCFLFPSGPYTACPSYGSATQSPASGLSVDWTISFPDSALTDGKTYAMTVRSTDSGAQTGFATSTFTYRVNAGGGAGDGEGSAAVSPTSSPGCQSITIVSTFTVGTSGLSPAAGPPAGAMALRVPEGWTRPSSVSLTNSFPAADGEVYIWSNNPTALAASTGTVNPPGFGGVVLGDNWVLLKVIGAAGFASGEEIYVRYRGFPPFWPVSQGPQRFDTRARSAAGGSLRSISSVPAMSLTAGPAAGLRFDAYAPITLGPLQTSPTMQLLVTDFCGAPTTVGPSESVSLAALVSNGTGYVIDPGATFYLSGGGAVGSLLIAGGAGASSGFYMRTSTTGPTGEILQATPASLSFGSARFVSLSSVPIALSAVSVDSGTLIAGATSVALNPASPGALGIVRFTLAEPGVSWELVLSTSAATFHPPVFRAFGYGDPAKPVAVNWGGINCEGLGPGEPCRVAKPGRYKALIRAGGGTAESRGAVEVNVLPTAFVHGNITAGAGSFVRAEGPGVGYGNLSRVATTYFEIFGLQAGQRYNVVVDTDAFVSGQRVRRSTTAFQALAALGGADVGVLAFPPAGFLRVQARLQEAAPAEFWGGVYAHTSDYRRQARGTLHFGSGFASSDDGAQGFGQTASTWTVLALEQGVYDVDLDLLRVGISSRVAGVSITAGQNTDLPLLLQRKANISGWTVLPSTTAHGAQVSVSALRQGERVPTIFSGTFIPGTGSPVDPTSAPYTLFGLDPGTWTVQARSRGFVSYSSTVLIVGNADLGGLDLPLGAGRSIMGTLTVTGDTSQVEQGSGSGPGFEMFVQARNPATFESAETVVRLATSSTVTSATFTVTGLSTGSYQVHSFLRGFEKTPPGPTAAVVTLGAPPNVSLDFEENSSRIRFDIRVPRPAVCPVVPASDTFKNVGFAILYGPDTQPNVYADITKLEGEQGITAAYHCSSMTILSPPTGNGYYSFQFMHGPTGNYKQVFVPLANRTTATAGVRLDESTFTVSGLMSLTGSATLSRGGFTVTVSSVAGLIAQSTRSAYCLLSATSAVSVSNVHVELIPLDRHESRIPGPLQPAAGVSCSSYTLSNQQGGGPRPSLAAYLAQPSATGYYELAGVPAGSYLLRTSGELDGDLANGSEIASRSRFINVGGHLPGTDVALVGGSGVSGSVRLPAGSAESRPVRVSISDEQGQTLRSAVLSFNGQDSVPYVFDRIGDGRYVVQAEDFGFPRRYAAVPVIVDVAGADVSGRDLQMVTGATIKGKLAVEQILSDGTRAFQLITQENRSLLPQGTRINAVADPWSIGGFARADGENCGPDGCGDVALDANGEFTIQAVLPGRVYNVEAEVPTGFSNLQSGALNLVPAVRSGVMAEEGQIVYIGILRLRAALSVSGTVTVSGSTQTLANIKVRAEPSVERPGQDGRRRGLPEAETDADGRYELTGLDPEVRFYDVIAARRPEGRESQTLPPYETKRALAVDVRSTTTVNFALAAAPFSISGRVSGVAGVPLLVDGDRGSEPGAIVFVEKSGVLPTETPIGDIMHQTAPDGSFTIPSLSSGAYRLRVLALDYSGLSKVVQITTASASAGVLQLSQGASLSGRLRKPDGSSPSDDEVNTVAAATANFEEVLIGTLDRDPNTRTVSDYRISGFRAGSSYRLLLIGDGDQLTVPDGASNIVFTSSAEARALDVTVRPPRPSVLGTSRRSGSDFLVEFVASHPLRARTAADDALEVIVATVSASGSLSQLTLDANRRRVTGVYTPGASESSFTVRFAAYSAFDDPASLDPVNPEFFIVSTFTFYAGIDGYHRGSISNFSGGDLVIEGDSGRVKLPSGALAVEVSSTVSVIFQKSSELLPGSRTSAAGSSPAEVNIKSLRHRPDAYPGDLFRAMAATPPQLSPFSAFYDILLPLGVRTALNKAAEITVHYSSGTDPNTLNVYWYNEAANAYVLEQNFGQRPVIDTVNRTITIKVSHFSTFVLFNTGVAVISGNAFGGGQIEAYNFPNPFDLSVKTVTPIHGLAPQSVRGTMIRFALPPDAGGAGKIKVFNVAGELVRTIDLGTLTGGRYYYQGWDGRNDSGRDVASGVYVGQVKVGERSKFFKMALIK